MEKSKANEILSKNEHTRLVDICQSTLAIVRDQPTKSDMKDIAVAAANESVRQHVVDCGGPRDAQKAAERAAQNTGTINVLRELGVAGRSLGRVSVAPAKAGVKWIGSIPRWAQVVGGIGVAAAISGVLAWQGDSEGAAKVVRIAVAAITGM